MRSEADVIIVARLTKQHSPSELPQTERNSKPIKLRVVTNTGTVYYCSICEVALGVDKCFDVYLSKKIF
jgi:hypothetical protein